MTEPEKNLPVILIVDDDKDFTEILAKKLTKTGFDVRTGATNGEEAIQKAKEIKPDLMLMDVQMPKLNGMQALRQMKADPIFSKTKVIFMTSYGDPSKEAAWLDEKYARDFGALDYIRKTDDLDKILREVKNILIPSQSGII